MCGPDALCTSHSGNKSKTTQRDSNEVVSGDSYISSGNERKDFIKIKEYCESGKMNENEGWKMQGIKNQ